jgi:hypothetical protein
LKKLRNEARKSNRERGEAEWRTLFDRAKELVEEAHLVIFWLGLATRSVPHVLHSIANGIARLEKSSYMERCWLEDHSEARY